MKKILQLFICLQCCFVFAKSQQLFPQKCMGEWKGTMYIYNAGVLRDSVPIVFTVAAINDTAWTWKTQYLSDKMPMTKDYVLRLKDKKANIFVTDEGGGIELTEYVFENKMYSVFETSGVMLTSTYELLNNELMFEVTAGGKIQGKTTEVISYSVKNLQRAVLKKPN